MIPLIGPVGSKLAEGAGTFLGDTLQPAAGIGASFADMLGHAAGATIDNLQQAQQFSAEALKGKGDMRSVVDAVMSAEQSLQAAVAIRDKIVSAYLEISRMAI